MIVVKVLRTIGIRGGNQITVNIVVVKNDSATRNLHARDTPVRIGERHGAAMTIDQSRNARALVDYGYVTVGEAGLRTASSSPSLPKSRYSPVSSMTR